MRHVNRLLSVLVVLAASCGILVGAGAASGRYRTATVLSGSMQPTLSPGDVVVAAPTHRDNLEVGDVITFQLPDGSGNITHRIHQIDDAGDFTVTTKGDANSSVDGRHVRFVDETAWRTTMVIPKVGYLFVATRAVLEQDAYLPVIGMLLAASLLWSIWRPAREGRDVVPA